MDYKQARKISRTMSAVGIAIGVLSGVFSSFWLAVIATVLLGGSIWVNSKFYRCPHCRASLEVRGPAPSYCPCCGHRLD